MLSFLYDVHNNEERVKIRVEGDVESKTSINKTRYVYFFLQSKNEIASHKLYFMMFSKLI